MWEKDIGVPPTFTWLVFSFSALDLVYLLFWFRFLVWKWNFSSLSFRPTLSKGFPVVVYFLKLPGFRRTVEGLLLSNEFFQIVYPSSMAYCPEAINLMPTEHSCDYNAKGRTFLFIFVISRNFTYHILSVSISFPYFCNLFSLCWNWNPFHHPLDKKLKKENLKLKKCVWFILKLNL